MWISDYIKTLYVLYTKNFKNRSGSGSANYQKFLIIGLPRCGTTLLHTYLNSHPNILSSGEVSFSDIQQNKKNFFPPLNSEIMAAGVKILLPYDHNNVLLQSLLKFISAEPTLKIIFIKRANPIRIYISYKIAQQTKQWSNSVLEKKTSAEARKVTVDIPDILRFLSDFEDNLNFYQSSLKKTPLLQVQYEALSEAPNKVLTEVQSFLNVPHATLISLLKKQNPENFTILIKNYQELHYALSGTQFSKYLND